MALIVVALVLFATEVLSIDIVGLGLLPLSVGSAKRAGVSVSKVLMPLAYASILAGSITVIATSANLVISGELPSYGLERIGFFELAPVGIGLTLVGLVYLLLIAPRLIPDRFKETRLATYGLRRYISEVVIPPGSKLEGQTLTESKLGETLNITVLGVKRGDTRELSPRGNVVLEEGDVLLIEGDAEDILAVKDVMGIDIHTGSAASDPDLESDDVRMVEAMIMPDSRWVRKSPRGAGLRKSAGQTVLAIHSPGRDKDYRRQLARTRLKAGDVLPMQGRVETIEQSDPRHLLNLEDVSGHHLRSQRGPIAASICVASLIVGGSGLLPMSIAFLAGGVALVLTGSLRPEETSVDRLAPARPHRLHDGFRCGNEGDWYLHPPC